MGMPSVPQLLIILVIVVLIFGAKRLKNLGGDLGSAVKGFKAAVKDEGSTPAELEDGTEKAEAEADAAVMQKSDEQKSA
jgi:sec-independent protein translocase protein TatA